MTKIAITTVNFNGKTDTLDWLKSLKKLDTKEWETKIFIASNQELKGDFKLLYNPENRGSAGGYNAVAKAALAWGADYLLMFNNDTLIKSTSLLKSLLETASKKPEIGVVAPKMLFAPGFEFYKEKYPQSDLGRVIWYAGGSFDWENVMSTHRGIDEVDTGKYDTVEETDFINITCILVKAEVFRNNLFFDERLFAYFDDNDWSERLSRTGIKKYYDGRVAIYHKVSRTAGIGSSVSDYYVTRNRLIFGMRYAPWRTKGNLLREALRLLVIGRPAQKRGVLDFILNKRGQGRH